MYKPQFIIFVETVAGEIIEAFTWCKDEASGLRRAEIEARRFGYTVARAWAEPVKG